MTPRRRIADLVAALRDVESLPDHDLSRPGASRALAELEYHTRALAVAVGLIAGAPADTEVRDA